MSIVCLSHVMRKSEAQLGARLVLFVLAEHAHDDGSNAFPAVLTMAERTRMSRRAVQSALRRLEADGEIRAEGVGPNGQTIYRVIMGGADSSPLQESRGEADDTEGRSSRHEGGEATSPNPSVNPSEPVTASSSATSARAWEGVPDEMGADAVALLDRKVRVNAQVVTEDEMRIAAAALAEFNRQMESDYGLGANLTGIVMRARERPSWDARKHVRLVQSAWRFRWWERNGNKRRPTPQVIYGARAFENVVQDAADEAAGRKQPENFDLRTKCWPDGRTFDQLTPGEQISARELVARGERPWLPEEVRQGPVMALNGASNGNGHGPAPMSWTAENFAGE